MVTPISFSAEGDDALFFEEVLMVFMYTFADLNMVGWSVGLLVRWFCFTAVDSMLPT
jgi:hypothetical protein